MDSKRHNNGNISEKNIENENHKYGTIPKKNN
jgi:hypothetical protein